MLDTIKQSVTDAWDATKRFVKRQIGRAGLSLIWFKTNYLKPTWQFILDTDITFAFVFMSSYILTFNYAWWERLLFSIGLPMLVGTMKRKTINTLRKLS